MSINEVKCQWFLVSIVGVDGAGQASARYIDVVAPSLVNASITAGNLCEPMEDVALVTLMGTEEDFRLYRAATNQRASVQRMQAKIDLAKEEYTRTSGQYELFDCRRLRKVDE